MAEAQTNNQEIKNLSWLQEKLKDQSTLDWWKIKEDLKKIYWIDIDIEVFNITKEELDTLKLELSNSSDKAKTLYENLYKERLETKIQTNWIKEVNIDNAMSWLENDARLTWLKDIFSKWLDSLLNKPEYQFLWDRKEMFKLAIATDLMNWEFFKQIQDVSWGLTSFVKDMWWFTEEEFKKFADWKNSIDLQTPWNNAKETFDKTIAKHLVNLNTIKDFLNTNWITDNKQQQNIVSNIPAFNDPAKIQTLTKEEITNILTQDFINTNKDKVNDWKDEITTDKLTQYMLDSRNKLQDKLQTMKLNWDNVMNSVLNLVSREGIMWEATKWILEMLLQIPFIWKILAMFLWLDKTNPMQDLDEKLRWHKMFKSFIENYLNIDSLKTLDKNSINQKELESEFKWLTKVKPWDISEKDFLSSVFSKEWYTITEKIKNDKWKETEKTYNIKIDVKDENSDKKIDQKELQKAINQAKTEYETKIKESQVKPTADPVPATANTNTIIKNKEQTAVGYWDDKTEEVKIQTNKLDILSYWP